MQTEVEEVYEPFHEGHGSSSTMPQKRNPLAAHYKLPAVYYRCYFVEEGGLVSYGYDVLQQFQDRWLCRSYPQRREVGESSSSSADQVSASDPKAAKALGFSISSSAPMFTNRPS
jgi:hypothetical protein